MVIFFAGSHSTPSLWAGTNGGAVFAYMLRLPTVERRMDDQVTAHAGLNQLHAHVQMHNLILLRIIDNNRFSFSILSLNCALS